MTCSHTSDCPLYAQFKLKALLKYWSTMYCESGWENCARYQLSLRGETVPVTLLPNGKLLAGLPKPTP